MVADRIKNVGIYDFLNHSKGSRYVGLITTRQISSLMELNSMSDHWSLISCLGGEMFPHRDISYYNGDLDSYISIFAEASQVYIDLPSSINQDQKEALIRVLKEIQRFEEEKGVSVFFDDYNHFYEMMDNCLEKGELIGWDDDWDDYFEEDLVDNSYTSDEKIIGISLSEASFPSLDLPNEGTYYINDDSHSNELESMLMDKEVNDGLFLIDEWYDNDDFNHTF